MAGVIFLPTERAGAESRPSTACRFEPAGTGKVRAITDGRSFTFEDGREIRLAGIEVPLLPAPGDLGTRAKAGLAARAALESIIAGQNVELRQNDIAADRDPVAQNLEDADECMLWARKSVAIAATAKPAARRAKKRGR